MILKNLLLSPNKSYSELNLQQQSTEEWQDQIHLGSLNFKLFSVIKKNKCGDLFFIETNHIKLR